MCRLDVSRAWSGASSDGLMALLIAVLMVGMESRRLNEDPSGSREAIDADETTSWPSPCAAWCSKVLPVGLREFLSSGGGSNWLAEHSPDLTIPGSPSLDIVKS